MNELDRLLEAARLATPDPIGDAETEALIRRAKERASVVPLERARAMREEAELGAPDEVELEEAAELGMSDAVERVLERARAAEPAPLTERELRAMVQRAAITGRARHRSWTRRRVMAVSAFAATLAAAAVTLVVFERRVEPEVARVTETVQVSEPTDLDLPTGDKLVAASGARFEVELPAPRVRRVRLSGGSMLFDVRSIDRGRFAVSTRNARIVVLGTVFSVRATEHATTVWVYEGAVRVQGPDGTQVVEAGGVVHLGEGSAGQDELATAGREAAARRLASASAMAADSSARAGTDASDAGTRADVARPRTLSGASLARARDAVSGTSAVAASAGGLDEDVSAGSTTAVAAATRGARTSAGPQTHADDVAHASEPAREPRVSTSALAETRSSAARSDRQPQERSVPAAASAATSEQDRTVAAGSAQAAGMTVAEARALIAQGRAARALAAAEAAVARGEVDPWRMLEGDALRVLGRHREAADVYRRAARELPAPRRQQAGFLEARVRWGALHDAEGALHALRSSEVTARGSVLRERALVLEVQLLRALGRRQEAAEAAAVYLRDYPDGPDAEALRAHQRAGGP